MSTPFEPPADDANSADWASPETETVTETTAAHADSRAGTEPAMATESTDGGDWEPPSGGSPVPPVSPMPPAPAVSRPSGSHGKTVALAAGVAAVAGLAGGFAIRAAHASTGSNTSQPGFAGDQGRGSAVTRSDDGDTGGVLTGRGAAGRGAAGRGAAGAVPSPVRGGGQSSTSSGGS